MSQAGEYFWSEPLGTQPGYLFLISGAICASESSCLEEAWNVSLRLDKMPYGRAQGIQFHQTEVNSWPSIPAELKLSYRF